MGRLSSRSWARNAFLPSMLAILATIEIAGLHPRLWQWGAALEVLGCACLVLRLRLTVVAPVAAVVAAFSPIFIDPGLSEPATPIAIAILAVYSLARWNPGRRGLIGMAGVGAQVGAMYVVGITDGNGLDASDLVFVACLLTPPYVLGRLTRRLCDQAEQLERQQEVVRRAAVREERDRIARDLHDVIAHSVSAMVVQTTAAQDLVRTDPAKAEALLSSVAATGREALSETGPTTARHPR